MNVSIKECSVITVRVVVIMAQIQPDILGNADLSLLPPHAPTHPSSTGGAQPSPPPLPKVWVTGILSGATMTLGSLGEH